MLFIDRPVLTSQIALDNLDSALEGTDYRCYTAVLEKKYHPAICLSYGITSFPCLVVLDNATQVLYKEDRVRYLGEEKFRHLLQHIASYRTTDL